MLLEIYINKKKPAQIWLTYTFKELSLVNVYAVMICIIHDWINMLIEIYMYR